MCVCGSKGFPYSCQELRALCMRKCGWPDVCSLGSKEREAWSMYHEPAVCLENFTQHCPACVREPLSRLHSCRFTNQELQHSSRDWEISLLSPSPSPSPLPREGETSPGEATEGLCTVGSLFQAGCIQAGDFFHCFYFPMGRTVGSQPRTMSSFPQNSGVRDSLCCICKSTHIQVQTRSGLCHFEGHLVASPVEVLRHGHQ